MSFPKLIATTLLAGSLAVGGVALAGPDMAKSRIGSTQLASEDETREYGEAGEYGQAAEGEVMGMTEIIQLLSAEGYGEVREIEREGRRYEVKARDREGRWRELYVDARTGEVLGEEYDD